MWRAFPRSKLPRSKPAISMIETNHPTKSSTSFIILKNPCTAKPYLYLFSSTLAKLCLSPPAVQSKRHGRTCKFEKRDSRKTHPNAEKSLPGLLEASYLAWRSVPPDALKLFVALVRKVGRRNTRGESQTLIDRNPSMELEVVMQRGSQAWQLQKIIGKLVIY